MKINKKFYHILICKINLKKLKYIFLKNPIGQCWTIK